jgi:hypothetical protein
MSLARNGTSTVFTPVEEVQHGPNLGFRAVYGILAIEMAGHIGERAQLYLRQVLRYRLKPNKRTAPTGIAPILEYFYGNVLKGGQIRLSYEQGKFKVNYWEHQLLFVKTGGRS